MSKIHYFPRYTIKENAITNNTLQLIARIYSHSPLQASRFLTNLIDDSIEIGIEITQQERRGDAVPDGIIVQRNFKILLEAKVGAAVNTDQLVRHSAVLTDDGPNNILLLLTTEPISPVMDLEIRQLIAPGVVFKNVTYDDICKHAAALYKDYEYEMADLVQDYTEYCDELGLRNQSRHLMRVVPCGTSFDVNLRHGIYFQPSDRGYTTHQYVGIYKDKAVRAVWELNSVFDVTYLNGVLSKILIQGRDTEDYDQKVIQIIADAKEECDYEIAEHHRFFCGHKINTLYRKTSPGGIMGARLVNLSEAVGSFSGTESLADLLSEQTFE